MRLDQDAKDIIEYIKIISGEPVEKIRSIFEAYALIFLMNILEHQEKEVSLPFIANISLSKEGSLQIEGTLHESMSRDIKAALNGDNTDLEKIFRRKIKNEMETIIEQA
jgi:hypothetical protein